MPHIHLVPLALLGAAHGVAGQSCDAACLQGFNRCTQFVAAQQSSGATAAPEGVPPLQAASVCRRDSARCRADCRSAADANATVHQCTLRAVPSRVPFIDGEDTTATFLLRWEGGSSCTDGHVAATEWVIGATTGVTTPGPAATVAAIEHDYFAATLSVPLASLPFGLSTLQISSRHSSAVHHQAEVQVVRAAPPAPGATATVVDNLRGGLTRRSLATEEPLPLLPYGFYQYSVKKADGSLDHDFQLPTAEVTHSMNLVSPYASAYNRSDADFASMRLFLDRCAALGVVVHYQLIAYETLQSNATVLAALAREINAFKDHPALLAWYLADEPDGSRVPPALFAAKYAKIKELDPYHPVSMVFCSGGAKAYLSSLDLIMVDPYPIPRSAASSVTSALDPVVILGKPVIMVPQAFGGGENWARAPSAQEERLMAYLGLIHGAIGWQYFVRSAPVSFPYAASAWSELRQVAAEMAELTPAVLSGIKAPTLSLRGAHPLHPVHPLQHRAWKDRNGTVYVCVVNPAPTAVTATLTVEGVLPGAVPLLLFDMGLELPKQQDSRLQQTDHQEAAAAVSAAHIDVTLLPLGTVVYRIDATASSSSSTALYDSTSAPTASAAAAKNLIYNPSYELAVNIGVPDGNYVGAAADEGATFFADSRLAVDGLHSLRLCNPSNESAGLSLAPYTLGTSSSHPEAGSYLYSIWAKGAQGGETLSFTFGAWAQNAHLSIACTTVWVQHQITLTVTSASAKSCTYGCRSWLRYTLASPGVAWLDAASLTRV